MKEYKFFTSNIIKEEKILSLDKIVALQVFCEKEIDSRKEWQLNLITDKKERINIIKSVNHLSLVDGANTISHFLEIPVWEDTGVHRKGIKELTLYLRIF